MAKVVDLQEVLGHELEVRTEGGKVQPVLTSSLKGKVVGIYFSAHWCPPCRNFTPVLRRTFHLLRGTGRSFEIVFVSSDRDIKQFQEYFSGMPWLAVPYKNAKLRENTARTFGVMGIPTLAVVGPNGELWTWNARAAVMQDPYGKNFPWKGMEEPRSDWWRYIVVAAFFWILITLIATTSKLGK